MDAIELLQDIFCPNSERRRRKDLLAACNRINNQIIDHMNIADERAKKEDDWVSCLAGYEEANVLKKELERYAEYLEELDAIVPDHIQQTIDHPQFRPPVFTKAQDRVGMFAVAAVKTFLFSIPRISIYILLGFSLGMLLFKVLWS